MKRLGIILLLLIFELPFSTSARATVQGRYDLGSDVSSFRQFIIYPHLHKGFSAMQQGKRDQAIAEFEHARQLAPKNVATALHLADAYRYFGEPERAKMTLDEQLKHTPENKKILSAQNYLSRLEAMLKPVQTTTLNNLVSDIGSIESPIYGVLRARFGSELKASNLSNAKRLASTLLKAKEHDAKLLDEFSFRLLAAGGKKESAELLLEAYPFQPAPLKLRVQLLERLGTLVKEQPKLLTRSVRTRMKKPLGSPTLRSKQAVLFAALNDCPAIHDLLGDLSPHYQAKDWTLLGDCYRENAPGLALYAYSKAMQSRSDDYNTRMVAYQAFATHDYDVALAAWRSFPIEKLSAKELKSATATALAAGDADAAQTWLDTYISRGETLDDQYWWLRAQINASHNPQEAFANIKQAIALRPDARYYKKLALLQQAEGDEHAAATALEQACALEPDNIEHKLALGYAYWRLNQPLKSRTLLDEAHQSFPDDPIIIQQLAYVNQRLGDNERARMHARQAIDEIDLRTFSETATKDAELRFGLKRLHEDLGRRWTFSIDATSGNQISAANSTQPGSSYRSYSQAEVDYRLGNPAINDGKTLSAYVRVFAGGGEDSKALPIHASMLGAGIRWKPWREQIVYFSVEQQTPLENSSYSQTDTMLRSSASFLNEGRFSDDWHASGSGWTAQNLYLDAAHYLKASRTSFTADYRHGYHHKVATSQTIEPYSHLQYNLVSSSSLSDNDLRVGLGVRWNWWHGGSHYDAFPNKTSVGLEFQHAATTYLSDKNSFFLTIGSKW